MLSLVFLSGTYTDKHSSLCRVGDGSYRRTYMPSSYHIAQELQKYNIPDYRPRQEQCVFESFPFPASGFVEFGGMILFPSAEMRVLSRSCSCCLPAIAVHFGDLSRTMTIQVPAHTPPLIHVHQTGFVQAAAASLWSHLRAKVHQPRQGRVLFFHVKCEMLACSLAT